MATPEELRASAQKIRGEAANAETQGIHDDLIKEAEKLETQANEAEQ